MKITSILMFMLLVLGCMGISQSFSQEEQRGVSIMTAEIVSVDPEEGILVVKSYEESGELAGEEIILGVLADVDILLEDEDIELYDLMPGDSLTIESYSDEIGTVVVTKVHLESEDFDEEEIGIYEYE